MLPGENHRERVLTSEEDSLYFRAASTKAMEQHTDPRLLADVARILLDCGLRPGGMLSATAGERPGG